MHPLILKDFLNGGSFFPIQLQHFADHAHKLFWDFVRLTVFTFKNLIEKIFLVQSLEGKRAHCQFVHQHPQRPHISLFPIVTLPLDDLWGNVMRGTAKVWEHLTFSKFNTEAKIDDLDVEFIVEKNVFHLDISVSDVLFVEVVKCRKDLFGDAPQDRFFNSF